MTASEQTGEVKRFGDVMQVGVVVRDLDRTIAALSDIFGMGPFRAIAYPPEGRGDMNRVYRGEPGDFTYRQAFVDLGTVELEIIQPVWAAACGLISSTNTAKASTTSASTRSTCARWSATSRVTASPWG